MANSDKDTIYVDIDDEITGIIDKLKDSKGKIVALVLPKRAAVFQSIVNMKLLKRAADNSKKHLVLITSEAGLLPLAGAAGIHVAKTLTSKPEIPLSPDTAPEDDEEISEDASLEDDEPVDKTAPVGALAGGAAAADGVETLELDDEDLPPEAADDKPAAKTFVPPKKDKKLQVPNFERFRLLLVLGGLMLILLIVGLIFANSALPKAKISIKTDATSVDANVKLNLSTTAKTLDPSDNTVPAKLEQIQKTYTQTVPTTGQKNNGNKASGSVTLALKDCGVDSVTIPAGAGITSSGGQTYITQSEVTLNSVKVGGNCNPNSFAGIWSQNVNVLANSPGTSFNIPSGSSLSVSSTITGASHVKGTSGSISGGTDNIVQSVNQNDINSAKSKIAPNETDIKGNLKNQLQKDKYYAIDATYSAGAPAVTASANVGEVANNVTVTETVTYTMFGVHKDDLKTLIKNSLEDQIDTSKQSILDDGLDRANFNVDNLSATGAQVTMSVTATAGPDLNIDEIKQQAAGKKPGAIKSDLSNDPDVTSVDVHLSPFWVSTIPKKTSRITVEIAKPVDNGKSSSSSGDHR